MLLAASVLTGCAALQRSEAKRMDSLLTEAGFQQRPADTADKTAHLARLPPDKLVSFMHEGRRTWAYADPAGCHCLLVGGDAEYERYRRLLEAPEIEQNRETAATLEEEDADDAGTAWEYRNGPLFW